MRAALLAPLAFLLALLASGAVPDEPGLLLGLAAVAVAAFVTTGRVLPLAAHAPTVAVRARRRALDRTAPPRQHDPDAEGHTRSRAPSGASATI